MSGTELRTALVAVVVCACVGTMEVRAQDHSIAELVAEVGNRLSDDVGDFADCSKTPTAVLDANVQPIQGGHGADFRRELVLVDGYECVYLQRPER